MKDGTVIIRSCSCAHEYQDEKYGKGLRVFNMMSPGKGKAGIAGSQRFRCTVCGTEVSS